MGKIYEKNVIKKLVILSYWKYVSGKKFDKLPGQWEVGKAPSNWTIEGCECGKV